MDNLTTLNNDNSLDFLENYNRLLNEQDNFDNPYLQTAIDCKFHDLFTLPLTIQSKTSPCYISLNVQSLNSKYESLKDYIIKLISKNDNIEIIALQEVWQIQHIDLISIPGFHPLVCSQRGGMRGGGVGFYIKNNISFDIVPELSPFSREE